MTTRTILLCVTLAACAGSDNETVHTDLNGCTYPQGAQAEMAVGEVVSPYRWPAAIHGDGRRLDLDLQQVFCDADPDIDWGVRDALLFVSVPAW